MMTLRLLAAEPPTLPTQTTWYLTDLAEARGKQELFIRQSPQKLKALREHALIESAVSSNRIEGVEVDQSRIATLLFGKSALRDRDEEEVRGYRDALKLIHDNGATLPISEATIKTLHKLSRGDIWDAGPTKKKMWTSSRPMPMAVAASNSNPSPRRRHPGRWLRRSISGSVACASNGCRRWCSPPR